MLSLKNDLPTDQQGDFNSAIAAASILAMIMLTIATVTVGIMVLMFVVRIIYLWILIALSPFAFLLSATPGMSGKFNEWWNKFVRYVFVGPILAFFLSKLKTRRKTKKKSGVKKAASKIIKNHLSMKSMETPVVLAISAVKTYWPM